MRTIIRIDKEKVKGIYNFKRFNMFIVSFNNPEDTKEYSNFVEKYKGFVDIESNWLIVNTKKIKVKIESKDI